MLAHDQLKPLGLGDLRPWPEALAVTAKRKGTQTGAQAGAQAGTGKVCHLIVKRGLSEALVFNTAYWQMPQIRVSYGMAGPDDIAPVLSELAKRLRQFYGERFAGLVLFGSYARGEAGEGSDVDLLLFLHGPVDVLAEIHLSEEVVWPLSLAHDLSMSLLPVSTENRAALAPGFLRNIEREGVRVA